MSKNGQTSSVFDGQSRQNNSVTLRDYFETKISDLEKLVNAKFDASEVAIKKAEEAQRSYNERSNEFRGQLDDQAKTLMPREEANRINDSYNDKLANANLLIEKNSGMISKDIGDLRLSQAKLVTIDSYETRHKELERQVSDLRESRSEIHGKSMGLTLGWTLFLGVIGLLASVAIILSLFKH